MYWLDKLNLGHFYMIRKYVKFRTFFNPENQLADKSQLFSCLRSIYPSLVGAIQQSSRTSFFQITKSRFLLIFKKIPDFSKRSQGRSLIAILYILAFLPAYGRLKSFSVKAADQKSIRMKEGWEHSQPVIIITHTFTIRFTSCKI